MPQTFNPGQIIVDETGTFGETMIGRTTPVYPPRAAWASSILRWLGEVAAQGDIGPMLLRHIARRTGPAAGTEVRLTPYPRNDDQRFEAWTITFPANARVRPAQPRTVFCTYTPPDARNEPVPMDPGRHPLATLVHELLHVLMNLQGVNTLTDDAGQTRAIAGWHVDQVYPSFNEFLATVVQNMFLSEQGVVLRDGYTVGGDDPLIDSQRTGGGVDARHIGQLALPPGVDLARFVATYRAPLAYLVTALPAFTAELAGLSTVPFNPFRQLRVAPTPARPAPTPRRTGAPRGAASVPTRISAD